MSKKVLITGTSSGFGKLMAHTLLDRGHAVAASMRDVEDRNRPVAEELRQAGAHVIEIDVTDEASVEKGTTAAIDALGGLDVLINNAGVGVLGLQEAFAPDDWQKLFDINVFGVQRVTRAVLPMMREQGSGLLMFVSSLLGRMALPFFGPYNASKYALEALADNYRSELSRFGIESVVIEPGGYSTGFGERLLMPSDSQRLTELGDFADAPMQMMEAFGENMTGDDAPDPQWIADAAAELIETPAGERPFRTVVDGLGMGDLIDPYNQQHQVLTEGIFESMGMAEMLTLKS
jgi:NAD(P)-dependent dehydrogenase (short-subunit alcohol dehydrogenase family)